MRIPKILILKIQDGSLSDIVQLSYLEGVNSRLVEVLFDGHFGVFEGLFDGGDLRLSVLVDVFVLLHLLEVVADAGLGLLGRLDEPIVFRRNVLGTSHPRYAHVVPERGEGEGGGESEVVTPSYSNIQDREVFKIPDVDDIRVIGGVVGGGRWYR